MFTSNMRESRSKEIRLPDLSKDVLLCILEFIYTGEVDIDSELAVEILAAANQYRLEHLKAITESTIQQAVDVENVVYLLQEAEMYGARILREYCWDFLLTHVKNVPSAELEKLDINLQIELLKKANKVV
jgi:hypothetical protein